VARDQKKLIAFVLYPGMDALDLAGALTVLRDLKPRSPIRTVVVGASTNPVATNTPLRYEAAATFADVPEPFALFVPGGGPAALEATKDEALLAYVRGAAAKAEVIGSFGNGALILAAAGVLDDRPVAVHWAWREELERLGARASWEMWVDDGRQLTAAGGSSGMDLMLAFNARLKSRADALFAQLAMEYDPEPPFGPLQRTPDPDLEAVVRSGPVTANPDAKTMALILYPDLTLLDLVGPLQVLATLERLDPRFRTVVVADQVAPMTTDVPLRAVADASFGDVPHPELIVVPGGRQGTIRAMSDPAIRAYVESSAASAELVTSVCTGSLILGAAGLLEGRPATTNWFFSGLLDQFGARYRRERWVHDGNIIMSAGVSAGIDMALYLVSHITDETTARRVQLALDYDPRPPYGGIDWRHIPTMPRMLRAGIALTAPLLARKAKRLSRHAATLTAA
jgi:transcriptional regulator GlxA family with amidase domain